MARLSNQLTLPLSSWKQLFRYARIPRFQFMVHDRWANVLFLHWRIPPHLEATLIAHTLPFEVERYDGSLWIGLILLTEEEVGPSVGRSNWTCITHHGINVRTYVPGMDPECNDSDVGPDPMHKADITTRGIHFSSLECDDEFTSFGANFFGMPYRVAKMERSYHFGSDKDNGTVAAAAAAEGEGGNEAVSSSCHSCHYRINSERLPSGSPSFLRMLFHALFWWRPGGLHSMTTTTAGNVRSCNQGHENPSPQLEKYKPSSPVLQTGSKNEKASSQRFKVECSWSRNCSRPAARANDTVTNDDPSEPPRDEKNSSAGASEPFHKWAAERYFVYTHKYGRKWRGQVNHEPWPIETTTTTTAKSNDTPIQLERLMISGVDAYEPEFMRPILRYMAQNEPNHVGFSLGVGPVTFTMLQPV